MIDQWIERLTELGFLGEFIAGLVIIDIILLVSAVFFYWWGKNV